MFQPEFTTRCTHNLPMTFRQKHKLKWALLISWKLKTADLSPSTRVCVDECLLPRNRGKLIGVHST